MKPFHALSSAHRLRVFGLPQLDDQWFDREQDAIEAARLALAGRERPAFAEIRREADSSVAWAGYLAEDRSIKENYEREPGAD